LGIAEYAWKKPTGMDVPLHACSLAIERLLVDVDRHRIRKWRRIAMSTSSTRAKVIAANGAA
jgi:hypothetical protein